MKINLISIDFTNRLEVSEEVLKLVGDYMADTHYSDKEHVEKAYVVSGEGKVYLKIEYDNTVVCKNILLFLNITTKVLYLSCDNEVICNIISKLGELVLSYERPLKFVLSSFPMHQVNMYEQKMFEVLTLENDDFDGVAFKIGDDYLFPSLKIEDNIYSCSKVSEEELTKYNFIKGDTCSVFLEEGEELLPLFKSNSFLFTSNRNQKSFIEMKDCELIVDREDVLAIYRDGNRHLLKIEDEMIYVQREALFMGNKEIFSYALVNEVPEGMDLVYEKKEILKSELSKKTNGAFSFFKY